MKTLILMAFVLSSLAFASVPELITRHFGVPIEAQSYLIGALSALLVRPLTAVAKQLGRTSGPTTVVISGVISALVNAGFGLYFKVYATPAEAIIASFAGFVLAAGLYHADVHAKAKALKAL